MRRKRLASSQNYCMLANMSLNVALRVGAVSSCLVGLALACSAGGNGSAIGGRGGNGTGTGTGATGAGASTGASASGNSGGTVNLNTRDASNMDESCNSLDIVPTKVTPTVLLLVDTSSSMFEPRTSFWDPLYNALMDPAGPVKKLQDQVRFGFTSYNSVTQPVNDPQCPKLTSVDFGLNNFDAINTSYAAVGATWAPGVKWETPTGESITKVTETLKAYMPTPLGPKYILLVTDGNPDTCAIRDPQCGEDSSIAATQAAFASGIGTFVIGIGDILTDNAGCVGRCGKDHLQDVANAGAGLPVAANTDENGYQQCTGTPAARKAKYAAAGEAPGTAKFYTPSGQAELTSALTSLLNSVASCTFEMNALVTGDPSFGTVTVGTTNEAFGDPNGWKLEDNHYSVTLVGTACSLFQQGASALSIKFPCEVAQPR